MILTSLVEASRLQFALTAMFHWIFVPLTLGLGFIVAFMETKYYLSGNEFWKKTAKFWMRIFGINFAVGVATGLILEFEFGTNWSNYSWFVGDIFGAPLAIEGIFAFFLEATFFAVMFFGWDKVSKRFHLTATWLTAIGANLSAVWILIANSWMQYPVGMEFNPETARSEMTDFWAVVFSPMAMNKLFHTATSAFMLSSVVVMGISAWFLLKRRETEFAKKSMKTAAVFGLVSTLLVAYSGDGSAYQVGKHQPMKLAAMEGLYDSEPGTPLVAVGILNPEKTVYDQREAMLFQISIPQGLSLLANRRLDSFVPGINDIIKGGYTYTDNEGKQAIAPSFEDRVARGKIAIEALADFNRARQTGDTAQMEQDRRVLKENFEHFGYGYFNRPSDMVPPVGLTFYSFRIMVTLGGYFLLFFAAALYLLHRERKGKKDLGSVRWFLYLSIVSIPLVYICSQAGWIVAEVGRQPWTIQNLLPVQTAVSGVSASSVYTTLIIFFVLFTTLLIAELKIMFSQIKKGPDGIK